MKKFTKSPKCEVCLNRDEFSRLWIPYTDTDVRIPANNGGHYETNGRCLLVTCRVCHNEWEMSPAIIDDSVDCDSDNTPNTQEIDSLKAKIVYLTDKVDDVRKKGAEAMLANEDQWREGMADLRAAHIAVMQSQDKYWQTRIAHLKNVESALSITKKWIKDHDNVIGSLALDSLKYRLGEAGFNPDWSKK